MQPFDKFQAYRQKQRALYGLLWVLLMALIGATYVLVRHNMHRQVEDTMGERMRTQVMVLQEHASRTLDMMQSRVTRLLLQQAEDRPPTSDRLYAILRDIPVVQGISLLDEQGKVISSSDPRRIGQRLRADVLNLSQKDTGPAGLTMAQLADTEPFEPAVPSSVSSQVLWLAVAPVSIGGREQRWVIALDVDMMRRLWTTVGQYTGALIGLFGPKGQPWVSSGHPEQVQNALVQELAPERRPSQETFTLSTPLGNWRTHYHAEPAGRWLLAVAVDERLLADRWAALDRQLNLVVLLAMLGVTAVVGLVFYWHRRFEQPMMEAARHSLALSKHLMVSESNERGEIVWANSALLERTGYALNELVGQNNRIFNTQTNSRHFYEQLWQTVQSGSIWKGTFRNRAKSGEQFWVNSTIVPFRNALGQIDRYVTMYSDITEAVVLARRLDSERRQRTELEALNRRLQDSAYRDPLTSSFNRRGFERFCSAALQSSKSLSKPVSLLMLDLDRFKEVNDEHGHAAGDEVLRELCRRWHQQIRGSDLLVRWGGEEFCIVLPNAGLPEAMRVAEKIRQVTVDQPVNWTDQALTLSLSVTVSIGVASTGPAEPYASIQDLQRQADHALYRAKAQGRNQVVQA